MAHRGYSDKYPENTMEAFEEAIIIGFAGIETDVQLTKDNVLVLIHDETIDRTSNGKGYVKDYTYEELLQFNFNNGMPGFEEKIPTLKQLLVLLQDSNIKLNIEIKTDKIAYDNIEWMTYILIKEFDYLENTVFSSFNHKSLLKLRSFDNYIYLGYLYEHKKTYQQDKDLVFEHCFNAAHPKHTFLNEDELATYLKAGIDVNTWTVNDYKEAKWLINKGVSIIISNKFFEL